MTNAYARAGVDTDAADRAVEALVGMLRSIDTGRGRRTVPLPGHYAAVVEVGTGAGVSTLWLLRGMRPDGVLTTVDSDGEHQRLARTGARAFGRSAALWDREGAPLGALFTHMCRDSVASTFLGGTTEIQRNVIATRGLDLPRG